ncbi:MAG TPA: hypothetical protein VIK83_05085, partial [Coriobacteriia bacterium]
MQTGLLIRGVPKGIRNLTCGFREAPARLDERSIVAVHTAYSTTDRLSRRPHKRLNPTLRLVVPHRAEELEPVLAERLGPVHGEVGV